MCQILTSKVHKLKADPFIVRALRIFSTLLAWLFHYCLQLQPSRPLATSPVCRGTTDCSLISFAQEFHGAKGLHCQANASYPARIGEVSPEGHVGLVQLRVSGPGRLEVGEQPEFEVGCAVGLACLARGKGDGIADVRPL